MRWDEYLAEFVDEFPKAATGKTPRYESGEPEDGIQTPGRREI